MNMYGYVLTRSMPMSKEAERCTQTDSPPIQSNPKKCSFSQHSHKVLRVEVGKSGALCERVVIELRKMYARLHFEVLKRGP